MHWAGIRYGLISFIRDCIVGRRDRSGKVRR